MSCHKCSSTDETPASAAPGDTPLLHWTTRILPEGSALLSSSCCWLPTVLDFLFAGSVSATGIQKLRPLFLALSIATLAWRVMRDGFTGGNIRRAIICAVLLAWAQYSKPPTAAGGHSCH